MSNRDAFRRLRPSTPRNRQPLLKITLLVALVVASVFALLAVKHRTQTDRELNWSSATATIEDVRVSPVARINSQRGGAMLCELQVLAKY